MSRKPKILSKKDPTIVSTSSSGLPKWQQSPVNLNKIYTWLEKFQPLRLNGHSQKEGVATMINTGQTDKKAPTIVSTSSSGLPKWQQSPVDLNKIYTWSEKFQPLRLNGHWQKEGVATMMNTGQTVKIVLTDRSLPTISGGPFKNNAHYQFDNLQFRWGPSNCRGAEHSIDNLWYSMEAQAIHWNVRYETMEKCFEERDGIAILSYLFQVVGCPASPDNPFLADITDHLCKIKSAGTTTSIPPDCLRWMLEACLANGYYTYQGSLTTPPYDECATWIIVPRPIKISARQVDTFRGLYDYQYNHIVRNYRSQHNPNGRRIFYALDDRPT